MWSRSPKKQLEIDLHLGAEKSKKCADRTEAAMAIVNTVIRIMVKKVTKEAFLSKTPPSRIVLETCISEILVV